MPYQRPQNLGSHGERRVIGFLTFTNLISGAMGALALLSLAGLVGPGNSVAGNAIRVGCAIAGFVLGALLTLRWNGISRWDTVVLWAFYQARRTLGKIRLKPPPFTQMRGSVGMAPIIRGGQIIAEEYDPEGEQALEEADRV